MEEGFRQCEPQSVSRDGMSVSRTHPVACDMWKLIQDKEGNSACLTTDPSCNTFRVSSSVFPLHTAIVT